MDQSFLNSGMGFIAQVQEERARQIRGEGFTAQHDDTHPQGDLGRAAAMYAMPNNWRSPDMFRLWPWSLRWWKPAAIPDRPQARQREIIKAAALLYAEWDRLERHIIRINAAPADTLAAAAITEPEILPMEPGQPGYGGYDPNNPPPDLHNYPLDTCKVQETPFEKAIRETAERELTEELKKHPVTIAWDYNQHRPEIITARAWYDEYNRLHLAFDQPLPKPDDPERFT
jgi:hypothetical protein